MRVLFYQSGGTGTWLNTAVIPIANVWEHWAFVADATSGFVYAFQNGIEVGTAVSYDGTIQDNANTMYIGSYLGSSEYFPGDMDEVTFVKNPIFANVDAIREAVQSLYENGIGINWKSATTDVNGNDSNTILYLPGTGTDGNTVTQDLGAGTTKHPVTFVGNAQIDTAQSIYGNGSYLFNGTTDYIKWPDSTDFAFGTNNFAMECFARFSNVSTIQPLFTQYDDANNYWTIQWNNTISAFQILFNDAASLTLHMQASWTPTINTWYHIAIVRDGTGAGDWYLFIDGVDLNPTVTSGNANASMPNLSADVHFGEGNSGNFAQGNFSNLRMSDTSRGGVAFADPTSSYYPLDWKWDNDSNVKLLLHNDGTALMDSSASGHTPTLNGNVARSSVQSVFGGYSAVLNGTTDYLSFPDSADWNYGSADWTISLWFYAKDRKSVV